MQPAATALDLKGSGRLSYCMGTAALHRAQPKSQACFIQIFIFFYNCASVYKAYYETINIGHYRNKSSNSVITFFVN